MFKEGQVYKVKVELSPDLTGFGRAMVIAIDNQRIYVQLKSSKGKKLNVAAGTKIWFVGSSTFNRFNGLWSSEVKGQKTINGVPALECRLPRFEQTSQRRTQARSELNAPADLVGGEWDDLNSKIITRNISRLGLGFHAEDDHSERFSPGKLVCLNIHIGNVNLNARARVVNCRFNWLLNRTEVGAEFSDMDDAAMETVERVLVWLGNRPRGSKAELSESGSLARWVKAGKDDHRFVGKSAGAKGDPGSEQGEGENEGAFDFENETAIDSEDTHELANAPVRESTNSAKKSMASFFNVKRDRSQSKAKGFLKPKKVPASAASADAAAAQEAAANDESTEKASTTEASANDATEGEATTTEKFSEDDFAGFDPYLLQDEEDQE